MPYIEIILNKEFEWSFRISADEREIAEKGKDILKEYPEFLRKVLENLNIDYIEIPNAEVFESDIEFHITEEDVVRMQQMQGINVQTEQKLNFWD